ncbi:MAG: TetR/AcrR family transcriptional regulator [Phycisphaerales bacterium]|nr:TetR/AcrR family transcriptional regulator [Phycisphaerales bacterium]
MQDNQVDNQAVNPIDPSNVPAAVLSRGEILRAAQRCFAQHGYDGTTIRRIAGEMNCAVGSIYRYFLDKRELLMELAQLDLEPVLTLLETGGSWRSSVQLFHERAGQARDRYPLLLWLHSVSRSADANDGNTGPLPGLIQRITSKWAEQLGSAELAQRVWVVLHGCIATGLDWQVTWAMIQRQMQTVATLHEETARESEEPKHRPQVVAVASLGQVMRQPVLVTLDALGTAERVPAESMGQGAVAARELEAHLQG